MKEVGFSRCHWNGADNWDLHSTVDIVSLDHLREYVTNKEKEVHKLILEMKVAFDASYL